MALKYTDPRQLIGKEMYGYNPVAGEQAFGEALLRGIFGDIDRKRAEQGAIAQAMLEQRMKMQQQPLNPLEEAHRQYYQALTSKALTPPKDIVLTPEARTAYEKIYGVKLSDKPTEEELSSIARMGTLNYQMQSLDLRNKQNEIRRGMLKDKNIMNALNLYKSYLAAANTGENVNENLMKAQDFLNQATEYWNQQNPGFSVTPLEFEDTIKTTGWFGIPSKPKVERKVKQQIKTQPKADKYGFYVGQSMKDRSGKTWTYKGNNIWE